MKKAYFSLLILALIGTACQRQQPTTRTDTMTSGQIQVAIDETCLPFMRDEIAVFEGLNPEASITPLYMNDEAAIDLLLKDSLRLVVAARDFTQAEKDIIKANKLLARSNKIAKDAVALIIHRNNKDTLLALPTLKKILTGAITDWKQVIPGSTLGPIRVVFDNPSSSTIRFVKDTVCQGEAFGPNIKSQPSNEAVIDFVANTPNALGIIGAGWIADKTDTLNIKFSDRIRVMAITPYDEAREDNSYLPQPAWIAMGRYPLTRDLYVLTSDAPSHLPSGFMHFLGGEKGQRLILKSGLVPANAPLRVISVKQ
ncbi:MAG: phosphate ABC transporter substrate-binding protein [Bacteroidales bacterium]|nr:phosphate ABC transporter substrate-binding protein [Bacteroidales bacterium]